MRSTIATLQPMTERNSDPMREPQIRQRIPAGRWAPRDIAGAAVFLAAPSSDYPACQADPVLRELRDRTGHTVHFALRNGDEAVYVEKLAGHKPYQMPSRIGQSLHLHSTAIGKAILAALTDTEVAEITRRTGMERMTPATLTSARALLDHLADIRRRGYAIDDEETVLGLRCVGAAVSGHNGQVVGAISISTLVHELSMREARAIAPEVVKAAREVSLALGAPPE